MQEDWGSPSVVTIANEKGFFLSWLFPALAVEASAPANFCPCKRAVQI